MTESIEWPACLADQFLGVAFFDGIRIDTDRITDPRWDRVLPILAEEQILMCRLMRYRALLRPGMSVLDVGTGSGVFAIWAAAHGCDVVAIDNSPRALKFANHNLVHPENAAKIQAAGGRVRLHGADFRLWAPTQEQSFDLVVLAPPYNPTAPGVFPARHAEAGPLGQDRFKEQLPIAYRVVKAGGTIVGNQMTFHAPGHVNQWWQSQIVAIGTDASRQCRVAFTSILRPEEYPAIDFLRAQYWYFLDPTLNPEMARSTAEYIRATVGRGQHDGVFGLYYYEIVRSETDVQSPVVPDQFALPFKEPAVWQDRIALHRRIVEHTSAKNSIPSAALFLHNDFTPPLPEPPPPRGDAQVEPGTGPSFDCSVLHTILTWVLQNRLIGADHPTMFDLLLIDIGPWFYAERGRDSIRNEVLLCGKPGLVTTVNELLSAYQRNTKAQQLCRLAPFLHPSFTGASEPSEWGGVHFHSVDDLEFHFGLEPEDRSRLNGWYDAISLKFGELTQQTPTNEARIDTVLSTPIGAAYATSSLAALGVAEPKEYLLRMESEYGEAIAKETQRRDLELVHMAFHRRLRDILKPASTSVFSSALLGMPLSMAFSGGSSDEYELPENYRGGLWIYAASTNRIGPREEVLIWDLARLAAITAGASINASATASLIEAERSRAISREGPAGQAWMRLSESAKDLFPAGNFHTASAWLSKKSRGKLPDARRAALIAACDQFMSDAIEPTSLDFEVLLSLARAASRGFSISVPFIDAMLGHKIAFAVPFPAIRCTQQSASPGKLIAAIYHFHQSRPPEVESIDWQVPVSDKTVRICLSVTYNTVQEAQKAATVLGMRPTDRMESEKRETPGEACAAAHRLRLEAKQVGAPERDAKTVRMWWEFACEWFE